MTTGISEIETKPAQEDSACVAGASTADVLRLLSAGAAGAILMALGEGPLRTKELTQRVPGYTPRTIYRYAGKLAELEVIEREEEPGVPSKVVHTLTSDCGAELYELVNRLAGASMTRLPDGRIDAHAWAALGLLGELWETGMIEELSCDPRSPTDLARGPHGLSYHQVNRRAGLFKAAGLLCRQEGPGRRRCYALTEKTRRMMGLIVGVARWRNHHVVAEDEEGMTAEEMATVLRAALPLARIGGHAGKRLELSVLREDAPESPDDEIVWVEVEADGALHTCAAPAESADAYGQGRIASWIPAILDGNRDEVLVEGDEQLADEVLAQLHEVLWAPIPL
jgi:DNA-binding HxlR family transcriptional regulator